MSQPHSRHHRGGCGTGNLRDNEGILYRARTARSRCVLHLGQLCRMQHRFPSAQPGRSHSLGPHRTAGCRLLGVPGVGAGGRPGGGSRGRQHREFALPPRGGSAPGSPPVRRSGRSRREIGMGENRRDSAQYRGAPADTEGTEPGPAAARPRAPPAGLRHPTALPGRSAHRDTADPVPAPGRAQSQAQARPGCSGPSGRARPGSKACTRGRRPGTRPIARPRLQTPPRPRYLRPRPPAAARAHKQRLSPALLSRAGLRRGSANGRRATGRRARLFRSAPPMGVAGCASSPPPRARQPMEGGDWTDGQRGAANGSRGTVNSRGQQERRGEAGAEVNDGALGQWEASPLRGRHRQRIR